MKDERDERQRQSVGQRRSAGAAVVCGACGAKIKAGRRNCLRCGADLAAAAEGAGSSAGSSQAGLTAGRNGPALIAGSVVSLLLLFVFVGSFIGRTPPQAIAVVQPAEAAGAPVSVAAPVDAAPAVDYLQSTAGGTAAYNSGDFASAEERYRSVLETRPDDADALNNLAQVLARSGRVEEALPYFDRVIRTYPDVWAYRFNRARAYGELEDWTRAIPEYRRAVELFPDDYATQFNLANALHKQGNDAAAVVEFEKAIALAPSEPTFYLSIAVSYENLNRIDEAVEAYGLYVEKAPSAPDARTVMDHIEALTGRPYVLPEEAAALAGGEPAVQG